jgi:ligand-binding SRPBCC domain-containing protein
MNVHILKRSQVIPVPIKLVFSFFENAENLSKITPPDLGFSILTPMPIQMRSGAVIDYVVHPFGIPIRWTTLIVDYEPPFKFSDVQLKGPYSFWHHVHTFHEQGNETLMNDEIHYVLPGGRVGDLLGQYFVKRDLNRIFEFRKSVIEKVFEIST